MGEVPHAYPDVVDRRRLRDALSAFDMTVSVHAPFTDLNIASPFEPVKGSVEKTLAGFLKFSDYLDAKMVTLHPGSVHNDTLLSRAAKSSMSTLRKMVKATGRNLSVNVENQTKSTSRGHYPLATTPKSLEEILVGVPGARCTLDTGHAHTSGVDPTQLAERLGKKLAEVHLSDNLGSADDHLIPGQGTAPSAGCCPRLRRATSSSVLS